MLIDCQKISSKEIYALMVQTIIPRPIAWILSDNGKNSYNFAPFSYFNGISSNPPIIMISVGHKSDGSQKDTWVNIEKRKHFVAHIPSGESIEDVVTTGMDLPYGESELGRTKLKMKEVAGWSLPRVEKSKVAFLCQKYAIYEIGEIKQGLILGQIMNVWLDDKIISQENGRLYVDAKAINPLARLGGSDYSLMGKTITVKRP